MAKYHLFNILQYQKLLLDSQLWILDFYKLFFNNPSFFTLINTFENVSDSDIKLIDHLFTNSESFGFLKNPDIPSILSIPSLIKSSILSKIKKPSISITNQPFCINFSSDDHEFNFENKEIKPYDEYDDFAELEDVYDDHHQKYAIYHRLFSIAIIIDISTVSDIKKIFENPSTTHHNVLDLSNEIIIKKYPSNAPHLFNQDFISEDEFIESIDAINTTYSTRKSSKTINNLLPIIVQLFEVSPETVNNPLSTSDIINYIKRYSNQHNDLDDSVFEQAVNYSLLSQGYKLIHINNIPSWSNLIYKKEIPVYSSDDETPVNSIPSPSESPVNHEIWHC